MYRKASFLNSVSWCTAVLALSTVSFAGTYSGGAGTELDPYLISSVADFDELRNTPADYGKLFEQTSDIDLSSEIYFGAVIAPDTDAGTSGFQGTVFSGRYDGKGFRILNYSCSTAYGLSEYVGLFGQNRGEILNLSVVNSHIDLNQGAYVGLFCGFNYGGTITNCHSTGTVECGDGSCPFGEPEKSKKRWSGESRGQGDQLLGARLHFASTSR